MDDEVANLQVAEIGQERLRGRAALFVGVPFLVEDVGLGPELQAGSGQAEPLGQVADRYQHGRRVGVLAAFDRRRRYLVVGRAARRRARRGPANARRKRRSRRPGGRSAALRPSRERGPRTPSPAASRRAAPRLRCPASASRARSLRPAWRPRRPRTTTMRRRVGRAGCLRTASAWLASICSRCLTKVAFDFVGLGDEDDRPRRGEIVDEGG